MLTPGSFNETYFEHAYLSRQLGFPLVEGHDLTVRDETVYLKTLSGLKRVHSILRRLDDDFCDPMELRADSTLGVPGLFAAVRKGDVATHGHYVRVPTVAELARKKGLTTAVAGAKGIALLHERREQQGVLLRPE